MWFVIICVVVVALLLVGILNVKTRSNTSKESKNNVLINNEENLYPEIQIVENNLIIPDEKNKIKDVEIKNAISVMDNTASNSVMLGNNVKNGTKLLKTKRAFFSASKKGTEKMMNVKGSNEVYGIQLKGRKFNRQTKFLNENQLIKNVGKEAMVNAGFNAASMVVGQYYMNEINNKLNELKDGINEISTFLDSEYKGRLARIVSKMQEIVDNKVEILNSEFLSNQKYKEIVEVENECAKLLGQANDMIKTNLSKNITVYKEYEENLKVIHKWYLRQQILQTLLLEIGDLKNVLAKGKETAKLSHTAYNQYLMQSNSVNEELQNWHSKLGKKLGIDITEERRNGKFFKVRKKTIGKINENWAYSKLDKNIVSLIENQVNFKLLENYTNENKKDVIKIQKYNGEYYNMI